MADLPAYLLALHGPDPFAEVREASEAHRPGHAALLRGGEQECGVYPSDAFKMRAMTAIVRAAGGRTILEIGGGLGYSALWFGAAVGDQGHVQTIDRFHEHITGIRRFAEQFGLGGRVDAIHGEGEEVLEALSGPYDVIHDDGWFAAQPAYYDRLADLLRPGGLLLMSNWFLLEHAVTGNSPVDWSRFAGPAWADDVKAYARRLAADTRFHVSFIQQPAFAVACRLPDA